MDRLEAHLSRVVAQLSKNVLLLKHDFNLTKDQL